MVLKHYTNLLNDVALNEMSNSHFKSRNYFHFYKQSHIDIYNATCCANRSGDKCLLKIYFENQMVLIIYFCLFIYLMKKAFCISYPGNAVKSHDPLV